MEFLVVPALIMIGLTYLFFDPDTSTDDERDDDGSSTPELPPNRQSFDDTANTVAGTDGTDIFTLGAGDDVARLGGGADTAFGGAGADQISGGAGDDRIFLGDGADQNFIDPDSTPDLSRGDFGGDDFVRGGDGADRLVDFRGSNTLYGDLGNDILDSVDESGAATTPDALFGGFGDDSILGDIGDTISGGAGEDLFGVIIDAAFDEPAVITDYETGEEIFVSVPLLFTDTEAELVPEDDGLVLRVGGATLLRIEGVDDPEDVTLSITASDFAEQTLRGDDLVYGTNGDDTIDSGRGDDAIFAGRGADVIDAGGGDDYVSLRTARPFEAEGSLGWGSNTVTAGDGADQVIGGLGDDTVDGGAGRDLILGGGGSDVLEGGANADRIDGLDRTGGRPDAIFGGSGGDVISADQGDTVTGGTGADLITVVGFGDDDAPVTVTDFNPDRDTLELAVDAGGPLTLSADSGDTLVKIGGRTMAVLQDISPRELRGADISLSSFI